MTSDAPRLAAAVSCLCGTRARSGYGYCHLHGWYRTNVEPADADDQPDEADTQKETA